MPDTDETQLAVPAPPSDRVRALTTDAVNRYIDAGTAQQLLRYASRPEGDIEERIETLDREWDFERVLEAEAAGMGLVGVALGAVRGGAWLLVPGFVAAMILLHAVLGPYPMLPLFRRCGVRTREEIEKEKYALKAMRGDFADVKAADRIARAQAAWRAVQL